MPAAVPPTESVTITELPTGLRIATERVPDARSVAIGVWVAAGARDEPDDQAGLSHFLEHLLFKGTQSRTARQIAEAVDQIGGEMNAFTAKEHTAYYCHLPAEHLALGLDLLVDVLTRAALRADDIEAERHVILEELAMDEDSPDDVVHRHLAAALFPGHPLGRDAAGTVEAVRGLSADDVRAFYDRWYRPAAMVLAAAGRLDHDAVVEGAAGLDGPVGELPHREPPGVHVTPLVVGRRRIEQVHLALGVRGYPAGHPHGEALDVLNHVLGGGLSSRLFEEIRERRGLAYSVGSAETSYRDAGAVVAYAATAPSQAAEVVRLVRAELERLAQKGITDRELEVATGYLCGSYVLGLEDTGSRMGRLAASLTKLGHVRSVADQLDRWRAVTGDQVAEVAAHVLGGASALSVVGPVGARQVARWS